MFVNDCLDDISPWIKIHGYKMHRANGSCIPDFLPSLSQNHRAVGSEHLVATDFNPLVK